MSKQQLPNNKPIDESGDEDYVYQQWLEQEKLQEQYWNAKAEDTLETINSVYETRFCYADVIAAVLEVTSDEELAEAIGNSLNGLYVRRLTFESYGDSK